MVRDLNACSQDLHPDYDLCIIGSGPAGGTLATELTSTGFRICVLESGGLRKTELGDSLRAVQSEGILIKADSRERVLGGTSTTWSGLSAPLDSVDFEWRYWVEHSGWPFSRRDIERYYREAAERFRFPSPHLYSSQIWETPALLRDLAPRWSELERKLFLAPLEPQNFGKEFSRVYQEVHDDLYLNATVTHLDGDSGTGLATAAVVRNGNGKPFHFTARAFVLAANGIENARLLLNSTFACRDGLGNDLDQVGRYLMNHPKDYNGTITLAQPVTSLPAYFGFLFEGHSGYLGLRLKEDLQRRRRVLNSYVRFEPLFSWTDRPGIESLVYFLKKAKFLVRALSQLKAGKRIPLRDSSETGDDSALQNNPKKPRDFSKMAGLIAADLPAVAPYLYHRLFDKASPKIHAIRIRNFMEMEPRPTNRVTLGDALDVFGTRLPRVVHHPSNLDRRSMTAVHEALRHDLTAQRWGQLSSDLSPQANPWPINADASHHMGSTRMGTDPRTSVVNRDCRLHFCSNVFVAGASVFPTSGNANPTFTAVALAIRLAAHLRSTLAQATRVRREIQPHGGALS